MAHDLSSIPALERLGTRTLVMGIINCTPDSFYDGGRNLDADAAVASGLKAIEDGADILDVGGESSRPGADPVEIEEECRRILPVIKGLAKAGAAVSVDTYHAETARRALEEGAVMVNDITALRGDAGMAGLVARTKCLCVLMHMQGTPRTMQHDPRYNDVVFDICAFFEERMAFAQAGGIAQEKLWLDPGFGFGKSIQHNLSILRRLREFKRLGRPVLIGTSNKSTIGSVLDVEPDDRLEGTAATVAAAIMNGADIVRVHDVRAMARVARMCDAIIRVE